MPGRLNNFMSKEELEEGSPLKFHSNYDSSPDVSPTKIIKAARGRAADNEEDGFGTL